MSVGPRHAPTVEGTLEPELGAELARLVGDFAGQVGVCALHATSGERILIDAARRFPTASTMKVFVLVALYQAFDEGAVDLETRVQVVREDYCKGSGVLAHMSGPVGLTLRDLATLMMMVSDNVAANRLIALLGEQRIRRTIAAAGLESTQFAGVIDFAAAARDKFALGTSSPHDMAHFMLELHRGALLTTVSTAQVLDVLRIQKYIEPLRRLLPVDPYAREFGHPEPVWVASKTGSLDGVRTEVGLVHSSRARRVDATHAAVGHAPSVWALSVMTRDVADGRVTSDNEAVLLISKLSRAIFDAWSESA